MTDRHDVRDPVCGMMAEPYNVAVSREYGGRTYCFRSLVCRERFDREPGRYALATSLLERELARLDGITRVVVNPLTVVAYVTFDPDRLSLAEVRRAVVRAGYRVQ